MNSDCDLSFNLLFYGAFKAHAKESRQRIQNVEALTNVFSVKPRVIL